MTAQQIRPLSEAQQIVIDRMKAGAALCHEVQTTGRYRMTHEGKSRTVHTGTVQSLIAQGLLETNLLGQCVLAPPTGTSDSAA